MNDQRSLLDQLRELTELANKNGLYDAADFLARYVAGVVEKPDIFDTEQTAFVSPLDCNHFGSHLLHAHRMVSTDGHEQNRVVLCRKCGQFSVFGDVNGQHFSVTFELVMDKHLDAAGQYMRYLDYCEKKRQEQKNER